jgi:hypothetical protein
MQIAPRLKWQVNIAFATHKKVKRFFTGQERGIKRREVGINVDFTLLKRNGPD